MNIIFGLGNPDEKYHDTRHNVGAGFLDYFITLYSGNFLEKRKLSSFFYQNNTDDLILVKPMTYMNNSGQAVQAVLKYYNIDLSDQKNTIFIAYDDLDIHLGHYKLQFGKGPKIHNGVNSVISYIHSDQFWHIRIGIDGRAGQRDIPGKAYVLQPFNQDEKNTIQKVFLEVTQAIKEKMK